MSNNNSEESIISKHSKKKLLVWQLISVVLFAALIITIMLALTKGGSMTGNATLANATTVDQKVVDDAVAFIKTEFQIPEVIVKETKIVDGLYEITISIEDQEMQIYSTPSGDNLVIPGLGILNKKEFLEQKAAAPAETPAEAQAPTEVPKSDKPKVEVFVMSHCPYGTQMEKGLIPVIETLGDKADISIKFVDYAMHGEKEVKEQLNQYCINKEEPEKYISYLKCFLEAGDGASCLTKTNIDTTKLTTCVSATDTQYKITELFNDKSTWSNGQFPQFNIFKTENDLYGVQGSPTTVINGVKVDSMPRNSSGILTQICSAFTTAPEVCQTTLDSTQPSAGFGYNAGTATDASCN